MSRRSTVAQSKEAEREVARELGGRRLTAGEWRGSGDVDVIDQFNEWVAQVKHRSDLPYYITEGFRQIREAVAGTDFIPLVVIRTKPGRGRNAETFVMMDVATWHDIRNKLGDV